LARLPNFGGIFYSSDLQKITFIGFPVAILIFHKDHWISIYIDEECLEVFDPLGVITNSALKFLHFFLSTHLQNKILHCSPRIQSANHSNCGQFNICFLFSRLNCERSMNSFLNLFSSDQHSNSDLIEKLFNEINRNN